MAWNSWNKNRLEFQGSIIGFALVLVPFFLMWPWHAQLGVGGSVALFVTGILVMTAASRFIRPSFVQYVSEGVGSGIMGLGVMGALSLLLEAFLRASQATP